MNLERQERLERLSSGLIKELIEAGYSPPEAATFLVLTLGKVFGMCSKQGDTFASFLSGFLEGPVRKLMEGAFNETRRS